jgi:hypothetical protein
MKRGINGASTGEGIWFSVCDAGPLRVRGERVTDANIKKISIRVLPWRRKKITATFSRPL